MPDDSDREILRDIIRRRRSIRDFDSKPVTKSMVEQLVWATQGITDVNGNRTSPSAHALFPLRTFVVAGEVDGMSAGLYGVDHDSGELRSIHDRDIRSELFDAALEEQPWVSSAPCVICICADMVEPVTAFALQPPTGERGIRYVHIEAGASAQNALLVATSMGIGGVLVAGFEDQATADALGLQPPLAPILHLCVGWPASQASS